MELSEAEVERIVRRQIAQLAQRYIPAVIGLVAFAVMVAVVPTVDHRTRVARGDATGSFASGDEAAPSGVTDDATQAVASSGSRGAHTSAPLAGRSGGGSTKGGGVAVSGVACAPGVRQVTWSKYAPLCRAAFSGNNGGATTAGVTASTITVTYRKSQSDQGAQFVATVGANAIPADSLIIADMQTYIDFFNKQFELYGRKVVLKQFQGQGDPIAETEGQNPQGAQADAATAKEMGAFADMSSPLGAETQMYAEALAANKILSFGTQLLSQAWYERQAPYAYEWQPTGDALAIFTANEVCQRMAGQPASFAGDPVYRKTTRVFGLLVPDTPDTQKTGDLMEQKLGGCGVKLAKRINYSVNLARMQSEATSSVAQMHAAGVTTVLCSCDPLSPIFLTSAADQQGYNPEWNAQWWTDNLPRNYSQTQWAHAITNSGTFPDIKKTEAYLAYKLANPGGEPAEQSYVNVYWNLLTLYLGLQGAGPNLTPHTFQQGFESTPDSAPGADFGPWSFGPKSFSPRHHFQVGWWDPSAKSNYDGGTGAYQDCNGGTFYRYDDAASFAPAKTQLKCFGS